MNPFAVDRLERAFREILKEGFGAEFRQIVENERWYSSDLAGIEVFRLWVVSQVGKSVSPQWVFEPIRVTERMYLCDHLGIPRNDLAGKTPDQVAQRILDNCGIPSSAVRGHKTERAQWREAIELIQNDHDAKASVHLRQLSERFLRRTLHYHVATGLGAEFVSVIEDPGSLRLPSKFRKITEAAADDKIATLIDVLTKDGTTDLGFLIIALRKLAKRAERLRSRSLFKQDEQQAFDQLATALQPYTHDKPSLLAVRKETLELATLRVASVVGDMIDRQVAPDEMLVLEAGSAAFGYVFRGINDAGDRLAFVSDKPPPPCKERVLFLATAKCDYARAAWIASPWPAM